MCSLSIINATFWKYLKINKQSAKDHIEGPISAANKRRISAFLYAEKMLKKMQNTTDMLNNKRRSVINAELIDVLTFFD